LVRDLATGTFVADQRNVVLVGGTGTGKSHLAIAIARAFAIGLEPMAPSMAHSETAHAGGSTMSSIWSIVLRPRPAAANRAVWPIT
jgi:nicotinamide riboside kinase